MEMFLLNVTGKTQYQKTVGMCLLNVMRNTEYKKKPMWMFLLMSHERVNYKNNGNVKD